LAINCEFNYNNTTSVGGAIYLYRGFMTAVDCIFNSNRSIGNHGGAIYQDAGITNTINCMFIDNNSYGYGGAVSI